MTTNVFGLSRNIPADVKRAVRQRCGFGCVICGASIYEYDHFDPPFAVARSHDPDRIALLCPTHHSEKTRGVLPDEVIRSFILNPMAVKLGRTSVTRPCFRHIPSLALGGGVVIEKTPMPVMVNGTPLIEFLPPEEGSDIARINASITSDAGKTGLKIVENEWIVAAGVWDYEWVGQRMSIRDDVGSVVLQITVRPPKLIEINRLRFNRGGFNVTVTRTELRVNGVTMVDCIVSNSRVGIALGQSGEGAALGIMP